MNHFIQFIPALLLVNLSCNGLFEPMTTVPFSPRLAHDTTTYYYNSFEEVTDLTGWYGISVYSLYDDAPMNGGLKSLYISGGCLIPHAYYRFDPPGRNIEAFLELFGKNLSIGGQVELTVGSGYGRNLVEILVMDSTWQYYNSDSTFLWPADSTLNLILNAGGYEPSDMLIDCLKLVEVN